MEALDHQASPTFQIESIADRDRLVESHPIFNKSYTLITKAIERSYAIIQGNIKLTRSGFFTYGTPQMGKSYCASAIYRSISVTSPKTYTILLSCAESSTNRTEVLKDILRSAGIPIRGKKTEGEIRDQLLLHICNQCIMLGDKKFVLILDEMQFLREQDYKQLLVLGNRLKQLNIIMSTVGFAQPEILQQRSALKAVQARQLIARFLETPLKFQGCVDLNELEAILGEYDNKLTFPVNSDWTFTRFFLTEAYAAGFRLAAYSELIWNPMAQIISAAGYDSVPMKYLTRIIELLLILNMENDSATFRLTKESINSVVKESRLAEFVNDIEFVS